MVSSQQIRYLILAGLMISLPAQPMGWFDSTKAKVGIAALLCASLAAGCYVWHTVKKSRRQAAEREVLRVMREQEKNELRRLLGDNVIIDETDLDFKKNVRRALLKAVNDRNEKDVALLMKWGGSVRLAYSRVYDGGYVIIPDATVDQTKLFLKYADTINVYYLSSASIFFDVDATGSINRISGELIEEQGRSILKEQSYIDTFLYDACKYEWLGEIDWALNIGANINAQDLVALETPIFVAARCEKLASVKLLLDRGASIDVLKKDGDKSETDIYDEISYLNRRAEIILLLDEHRHKKYNDNQNAIERETFTAVTRFPKPLAKITAAYAAEYPLMVRRPLVFKQEQEETVRVRETQMIEAPAEQPHPLSLDAQAV